MSRLPIIQEEIQNSTTIIIRGGKVVLENETVQASILIRHGIIEQIVLDEQQLDSIIQANTEVKLIDASGMYVLPGLIDIHCDAIEKEVQPRPNTLFPLQPALLDFERKLPVYGITTMYHSLSLGVGLSLRGDHLMTELIEFIHQYRQEREIIRNRIHLRYEVSYDIGLDIVEKYIDDNYIDYLSYMDHSPGQGQYRAEGSFEKYVMKNQGVTSDEVHAIITELLERQARIDWKNLKLLAERARKKGIAVASHDDDTYEKIDAAISSGVAVSEFPITLEVAQYATNRGMKVCVGAPNVVRGASHDNNLRAIDAISARWAHIICSDYHPSSMLQAIFTIAKQEVLPLHEATKLATLFPAEAMNCASHIGSIAAGKAADLIMVDHFHDTAFVVKTIVNGVIVYESSPFHG